MAKKWTVKSDQADDRRRGIKEGSAEDEKLDKRRGVLTKKMRAAHRRAGRKSA